MANHLSINRERVAPLLGPAPAGRGTLALVCEGGGQRGIFTAGVLDAFMAEGYDPFQLMIGSSAGAQNLSAFTCNAAGYAREMIIDYTTRSNFFRPLDFVRGGDLVDLDWYFEVLSGEHPLDIETGLQRLDGRELLFCSTRTRDVQACYFHPREVDWMTGMKASSAIPLFYRAGVQWQGERYQDGGIADAIPVQEAYRRGARTIVVIRTVPQHSRVSLQWAQRLEQWIGADRFGEIMQIVRAHERCYSDTQSFIKDPPLDARVIEIYPSRPLVSRVLGSTRSQLEQDYQLGLRCGRYFLYSLGAALLDISVC
ncbi:patatin-like phospholipase family protein [Zobellella maritima]|uniref:patatin-like phospholipase family protein n=1 Tax=Zobellella maritima TaxID=2059725 RepID=UPI000E302B9A|nr:patatin-like phospholipase family protein [Zobellella maritima]